jgi:hypothetical protein
LPGARQHPGNDDAEEEAADVGGDATPPPFAWTLKSPKFASTSL